MKFTAGHIENMYIVADWGSTGICVKSWIRRNLIDSRGSAGIIDISTCH